MDSYFVYKGMRQMDGENVYLHPFIPITDTILRYFSVHILKQNLNK